MGIYDDQSSTFGGSKSPISLAIHFFTRHLNKKQQESASPHPNISKHLGSHLKSNQEQGVSIQTFKKHPKNIQKTSKKQPKSPHPDSQAPQGPPRAPRPCRPHDAMATPQPLETLLRWLRLLLAWRAVEAVVFSPQAEPELRELNGMGGGGRNMS